MPEPGMEPLFDCVHALTHVEFSDGTLTPACTCGWYSPRRSHADFERHLRRAGHEIEGRDDE